VLLATTAGIEDAGERAARRAADARLADELDGEDIEAFADRWLAQPLFADDDEAVQQRARADIARNETVGLAAALRGVGTGAMTPLWSRLGELAMPVLVLAGERDVKFTAIGERLAAAMPGAELEIVPGAGHALPRAAPAAVARAISGR
jgi:pimeloyl-ACP methyl ester carboxylesterase